MKSVLKEILDWSETWAILIPIVCYFIYKPKGKWITPLKTYIFLAFIINLLINLIWKQARIGLHDWLYANFEFLYESDGKWANTLLYNLQSIVRLLIFTWFFHTLSPVFKKINLFVVPAFVICTTILFTFYKDIRDFNSLLIASESAILLVYCLIFYFTLIRNEETDIRRQPYFWAVTGLSIYVVINFPIFLFFTVLSEQAKRFAINIWDVHNIAYVVFSILIAKSFYHARSRNKTVIVQQKL